MGEIFAMVEGEFGKVIVIELHHDLVPQAHSQIQLTYWLGGGHCKGCVGDASFVLNSTMAAGVNRYQAHDITLVHQAEPVVLLLLCVEEQWFDANITVQGEPIAFRSAQLEVSDQMKANAYTLMKKTLFAAQADYSDMKDCIKKMLQLTVDSNHQAIHRYSIRLRRKMLDYRLRLALNHLRANMTQAELINSLAKTVNLSRSRLYELFKTELQSSPKLIHNSVLIETAIQNMRIPEVDLSVISSKLGFSTASNFSRFFRNHKGVAPSAYRKKLCVSAPYESTKA